jgi:outer membrane protein OmpA-like peptidoglycan-associated protein
LERLQIKTPDEVIAMHSSVMRTGTFLALTAVLTAGATGCASLKQMSDTQKGAIIGAAGGAVVGGAVGKYAGSTTKGAIIGAVVGGAAGAVIGHRMDEKAKELEAELDNANVERVGEGILVTFESGLLFDFDSAQLRQASRTNLNDLANTLNEMADTELLVAGHTDSVGAEDYNFALSERRAQAAANYLMQRGVAGSRINIVGLGESEPVAANESATGRQQNRRVEVAIYASEEARQQIKARYPGN